MLVFPHSCSAHQQSGCRATICVFQGMPTPRCNPHAKHPPPKEKLCEASISMTLTVPYRRSMPFRECHENPIRCNAPSYAPVRRCLGAYGTVLVRELADFGGCHFQHLCHQALFDSVIQQLGCSCAAASKSFALGPSIQIASPSIAKTVLLILSRAHYRIRLKTF